MLNLKYFKCILIVFVVRSGANGDSTAVPPPVSSTTVSSTTTEVSTPPSTSPITVSAKETEGDERGNDNEDVQPEKEPEEAANVEPPSIDATSFNGTGDSVQVRNSNI